MGTCNGHCGGCSGCARELTLSEGEITFLRRLGEVAAVRLTERALSGTVFDRASSPKGGAKGS